MAHEGAHALVGFFLFRSVRGVTLYSDGTGATEISPTTGFGAIPIALAGYVGPSAFGLGAAKLIEPGYTTSARATGAAARHDRPPARPMVPAPLTAALAVASGAPAC